MLLQASFVLLMVTIVSHAHIFVSMLVTKSYGCLYLFVVSVFQMLVYLSVKLRNQHCWSQLSLKFRAKRRIKVLKVMEEIVFTGNLVCNA